jgi:nucleotide-binding universal stress UspA family protein
MAYRTILTYTDGFTASNHRLSAAVEFARRTDAHLVILAFGFEPDLTYVNGLGGGMALPPSNAGPESEEATQEARDVISRAGIRGEVVPLVCPYSRFARELGDAAQFSDVVVLGRPYGDGAAGVEADAFEGALFDGDATIMLFPDDVVRLESGPVLIAWNGTREARRAVRRAMPLLTAAGHVEIAVFGPTPAEPMPGERLATWLSRHGIGADVVAQVPSDEGAAASLRRRVVESGAGLVVMGAYSHSRFREYVIGGVTRDYLADFPVPVLTAH